MNKTDDEISKRLLELDQICIEYKFWDNSEYQTEFHRLKKEQEKRKKIANDKRHHHLMATNWNYAIKEHIKTGLESPIPYKVIPYKNGIGIKKIEFFKPKKIDSNLERFKSLKFKQDV